ncbi:MAG: MCE family protein [Nocardioides sp.]|uniref:MCE family protein n=1 Tax=Nocardioides sp. TaxID=35761 RepID=UPI002B2671F5|nr:MCE family protein [Nocardioides sp.]
MVLTPLIKRQLRIFAALTVVALFFAAVVYARVPAMMGVGVYEVRAEYPDASGLYPKAMVTYQGVKVGEVTDLEVEDGGAVATLRIDDQHDIPADAIAELHSTSAIGEQYVDLVPPARASSEARGSASMSDGDLIPAERTIAMPQITPVLESVNDLLGAIPRERTRRVLDQVDEGLGGSGPDLAATIDAADKLIITAQARLAATTSLIRTAQPVLGTQQELRGTTLSYAQSLASFTAELADRDRDLRSLLDEAPDGLESATGLVTDLQPTLPLLVTNLTTNAEVLNTYLPQIQEGLVYYPVTVARLQSAINPREEFGDVNLDLRLNVNNPPACSQGYLPASQRRDPSVEGVRKVDRLAHCTVPDPDPKSVRGARLLPCPQSAERGPLPSACGLEFGKGVWPNNRGSSRGSDLARGLQGSSSPDSAERSGWQMLMLGPLEAR